MKKKGISIDYTDSSIIILIEKDYYDKQKSKSQGPGFIYRISPC